MADNETIRVKIKPVVAEPLQGQVVDVTDPGMAETQRVWTVQDIKAMGEELVAGIKADVSAFIRTRIDGYQISTEVPDQLKRELESKGPKLLEARQRQNATATELGDVVVSVRARSGVDSGEIPAFLGRRAAVLKRNDEYIDKTQQLLDRRARQELLKVKNQE